MPDITVYFNSWIPKLFGSGAVTIGHRIFFRDMAPVDQEWFYRGMQHELTHVRQYERYGIPKFLWIYFTDFLNSYGKDPNWDRDYRNIPFEIEAYENEEKPITQETFMICKNIIVNFKK